MRAVPVLVAALMLGLMGGYAWSSMAPSKPNVHVPAVITPKPIEIRESPSDQEWASRALQKETPAIEARRADPAAIEQSAYYSGCGEVRAAGKAPLYAGDPGYRPEMDGDGDGIACEPYRGM